MKTVVETIEPTRVRLLVEVPFEELQPSLDAAYKRIASQVVVPGFRKGKVPPRIIDQRIGRAAVLDEAVNDAIPRFYGQAVQDNDVRPIGQPEVEVTSLDEVEQTLAFTAEVDVRPDFTLPEWKGLPIQVADADPTEAEVQEQLDALRERFGTLATVERAAAEGDFVVLDLVARRDGEVVEGGEAMGQTYRVGSDTLVDGLDDAVTGLSDGESATFTTTLAGGPASGEVAEVEITVRGVKEQELPALDDDFAELASEFDTLEELADDVRERIRRGKRLQQAVEARDKVLDALLDAVDLPVPERVVQAQVEQHFADGHGDDDHRTEFEGDARRSLIRQLVLDEIAKSESIDVTQDDLTAYIISQAAQAGVEPQELADRLVQGGGLAMAASDVVRGKALALVVEAAEVTDASGRPVPLKRLHEDGTLMSEEEAAQISAAQDFTEPDPARV